MGILGTTVKFSAVFAPFGQEKGKTILLLNIALAAMTFLFSAAYFLLLSERLSPLNGPFLYRSVLLIDFLSCILGGISLWNGFTKSGAWISVYVTCLSSVSIFYQIKTDLCNMLLELPMNSMILKCRLLGFLAVMSLWAGRVWHILRQGLTYQKNRGTVRHGRTL